MIYFSAVSSLYTYWTCRLKLLNNFYLSWGNIWSHFARTWGYTQSRVYSPMKRYYFLSFITLTSVVRSAMTVSKSCCFRFRFQYFLRIAIFIPFPKRNSLLLRYSLYQFILIFSYFFVLYCFVYDSSPWIFFKFLYVCGCCFNERWSLPVECLQFFSVMAC